MPVQYFSNLYMWTAEQLHCRMWIWTNYLKGSCYIHRLKIQNLSQNGHYWSMLINIWKQHNTVQQSPRRSTFKEHQFIMSIIYGSRTWFWGLGFSWLVKNFKKLMLKLRLCKKTHRYLIRTKYCETPKNSWLGFIKSITFNTELLFVSLKCP